MSSPKLLIALGALALLAPADALAGSSAGSNGKIVFARLVAPNLHDIFVADPNGANAVDLTPGTASDNRDPAVSPDGTRIVFASSRSNAYNLFVINLNGTGSPIRLLASPHNEFYPAWSPDGNMIAYSEDSGDANALLDLRLVDAGGANAMVISARVGNDMQPAFSPDGAVLTFSSAGGIWEGSAPKLLTSAQKLFPSGTGANPDVSPTWSPTSSQYAANLNGKLYVSKPDGSSVASINVDAPTDGRLVWSPDGSLLLFNTAAGLFTVKPDGSGLNQVTSNAGDVAGDWVPGIANVRIPQIVGDLTLGTTLIGDSGVWVGSPSISYAYQWERCNPPGASGCQAIPGATAATYTTTVTDLNAALRLYVTASSPLGSGTAASAGLGEIGNPISAGLPTISGTPGVGKVLLAGTGTVGSGLGSAPLAFAFQWRRCDTTGNACVDVLGATNPSYTVVVADSRATLRLVVTATNSTGSATATSLATAVVGGLAPANIALPVIAGQPVIGQLLTASTGTWTGISNAVFSYQWKSCAATGDQCIALAGATGSTYVVTPAEVGFTILVTVTGVTVNGIVSADSAPTPIAGASYTDPGPGFPGSTIDPRLLGNATVGSTLKLTDGGFVGAKLSYAYQWQRCDTTGSTCGPVPGARAASYKVKQADRGWTIRAFVTASNSAGSVSAVSDGTVTVVSAPSIRLAASKKHVRHATAKAGRKVVPKAKPHVKARRLATRSSPLG
jgi:Tol biopolymer transport system component